MCERLGTDVANQGYNAASNWANRGASESESMLPLLGTFALACGTSAFLAVKLGRAARGLSRFPWAQTIGGRVLVGALAPYCAITAAGTLNLLITRRSELTDGVTVYDRAGTAVGVSRMAGWDAVGQTALSRLLLPIPSLTVPPLCAALMRR